MLTNLLAAYGRWVVRHRWTVLAAVLATTVLLGRAATHLRVEVDPDRQLPQDHPFIQTLNDVHRIFGDKNLVVVGQNFDSGSAIYLNGERRKTIHDDQDPTTLIGKKVGKVIQPGDKVKVRNSDGTESAEVTYNPTQ